VKISTERQSDSIMIKPSLTSQGVHLLTIVVDGWLHKFKILIHQ
jgi:hypothetical protein